MMAALPGSTDTEPEYWKDEYWSDTTRSGLIVSIKDSESQAPRYGFWSFLTWLAKSEIVTTVVPIVVTVLLLALEVYILGLVGLRVLGDALLWLIRYYGSLFILPVILFVGVSMMIGKRYDNGALGGIFGILGAFLMTMARSLFPVRGIYRNTQRIMDIYIIRPLLQNRGKNIPTLGCRLRRDQPPPSKRGRVAPGSQEEVTCYLWGDPKGDLVEVGRHVTFYGRKEKNGTFSVRTGTDTRTGATIEMKLPPGQRRPG